jgi:hypothetical protein
MLCGTTATGFVTLTKTTGFAFDSSLKSCVGQQLQTLRLLAWHVLAIVQLTTTAGHGSRAGAEQCEGSGNPDEIGLPDGDERIREYH